MVSYNDIEARVEPLGLCLRGGFVDGETYVLVGNVGSRIWEQFGIQYDDWIEPNPLDTWTKANIDPIAAQLGARAVYPFEGPDFPPFQAWAMKAEAVFPSPIGPLIHNQYGLWHAYRAALIFNGPVEDIPQRVERVSPCKKCETKPCLTSCPVDAFGGNHFRFQKCMDYLNRNLEGTCMRNGCLARQACPFGIDYRYTPVHARFHMDRFLVADFGK